MCAFVLKAQSIKGKLVDDTDLPIEAATIVLQTPDSIYVDVAYSDTLGNFTFSYNLNHYRLMIQHLLYDSYSDEFNSSDVGLITLKNKDFNLNEVVIKGERPLVKVINGKMTYDMPQLLETKMASNAYDALLELPGVYEQDDFLNLAGSNGVNVIINGKPSTMSNDQLVIFLKSLLKERIQWAEVMYNAPPQYHVRGAAINLILTGVSEIPKLQGQVNGHYNQSHYANYGAGTTLMYSTPKFSTDFMYSFGYLHQYSGLDLESFHLFDGTTHSIQQHNQGQSRNANHNFRLGSDYYFNSENKLSLVYTGQITAWNHALQLSKGTFSNSVNEKKTDEPIQMHNVTLDYVSGFGLSLGMDYTSFNSHTSQDYKEMLSGKEEAFNAQSKQKINRIFFYADQSHSLSNAWTLDYGLSLNYAFDKSSQIYHSPNGKEVSKQNTMSDLNEYTYELYAGFSKEFSERFSLRAYLTGEYYKYKDKDSWALYPEMEMTYVINPKHILQYGMGTDKSYPSYWEMINSVSYMNGYTEIHGNPDLKPYKTYTMQFSYILKNKYIFTLYTIYQDDYFVQLPYQASDRLALIYKTTNFDYKTEIGANAVIPFRVGSVLDSRLTLNAYYDKAKSSNFNHLSFNKDNFAILAQLSNTFNISSKPNIKAELLGLYTTRNIQGPSTLSNMYRVNAGIKWTSNNNKAEIRLKVDDLFNSWSPKHWKMKFENQNLNMHIIPDNRTVTLSFTYKFGDYKESKRKEVDTSRFGAN